MDRWLAGLKGTHFYPRSPCGERPFGSARLVACSYFYPRSPCGERRVTVLGIQHRVGISIHALLAESDTRFFPWVWMGGYFYPRSPCGERLHYDNYNLHCVEISIHALLAESDYGRVRAGA